MVNLAYYFSSHLFPRPDFILNDFSDIQSLQIDDSHIVSFFSPELIHALFKTKLSILELKKTFCEMLHTPFTCFLPGIKDEERNELIHCIINDTLITIWDACFYQLLKGESYADATAARNFSIYTTGSPESEYKFIQHIQNDFEKNHCSNPFWKCYWNSEIKRLNNPDESAHSSKSSLPSYSVSYYAGILVGLIHYLKYSKKSKLPEDTDFSYADLQKIIKDLVSLVQGPKPIYWKKLVAKDYNISPWLPLYHLNKTWKLQHTAQLFQIITNSQSEIWLMKAFKPASSTAISRQDNGELKIPSMKYPADWIPVVPGNILIYEVVNERPADEQIIPLCDEKMPFNSFELLFYLLSHLEENNQNLQTICCLIQYIKAHCIPLDFDSIERLLLFADSVIPYTQELIYLYLLNRTNEAIKNSSTPFNEEICFAIIKEIGEDVRKALTEYYSDTTLKKINLKAQNLLTPFEQKIFQRLITSIYFNRGELDNLIDPQNIPICPSMLDEFINNLKNQIK